MLRKIGNLHKSFSLPYCVLYIISYIFLIRLGGTPSGSRALATSLCGSRLWCGTSPRVKWGGGTVWGITSRGRGNSLRLACARHLPLRKEAWVWHLAAREMGGHGFGITSRGRGNSLRLACARHLPLRKEAWVWHLAAREMGGHGFGITSRGRGNSLRLACARHLPLRKEALV